MTRTFVFYVDSKFSARSHKENVNFGFVDLSGKRQRRKAAEEAAEQRADGGEAQTESCAG